MKCRDAERLIFAERDGALDSGQSAALAGHLEKCPACRRVQAEISGGIESWCVEHARVEVPDVEAAWRAIRSEVTAKSGSGVPTGARRFAPAAWMGAAVAAAAAVTFAFLAGPRWSARNEAANANLARAEYVEVPSDSASPVVFVDQESGWLVVWAVNDTDEVGL